MDRKTDQVIELPLPIRTRVGAYGIGRKEGKILLVKQGKGAFEGRLDWPGGGIEPGEEIEAALRREWKEEVALSFNTIRLWGNLSCQRITKDEMGEKYIFHRIGLIYEVEGISPISGFDSEMEFEWIEIEDLRKRDMTPFVEEWLKSHQH